MRVFVCLCLVIYAVFGLSMAELTVDGQAEFAVEKTNCAMLEDVKQTIQLPYSMVYT